MPGQGLITAKANETQSFHIILLWALGFLFVVGFTYWQPHLGGQGLSISFNVFSWIPISFILGLSLMQTVRSKSFFYSGLSLGLLCCSVLIIFPALYPASQDPFTQGKLYGLVAGLLLLLGLQQISWKRSDAIEIMFVVLLGIVLHGLLAWYLKFLAPEENVWGFDASFNPPFGNFRQPNVMASFLSTGLVLSAFLLPHSENITRIAKQAKLLAITTPLVVMPLILILNSRVGWLGAVIGITLAMPYLWKYVNRREFFGFLAMLGLGILVGMLLISIDDRGWTYSSSRVSVDSFRSILFPQVVAFILANPLTGVGIGNFEAEFNLFAAALYAQGEPLSGAGNLHHPHNEILYWAAEGGIVSLAGMLIAAWLVLKSILKAEKGYRLMFVGLFLPIVLHTQTEFPFYHAVSHWVVFILLIYLVDVFASERRQRALKSTLLFGTAAVIIPVFTSLFMATTLHAAHILRKYETEPGTSPEILYSIVNPMIWRDRILWRVRTNLMYESLASGDKSQVQPFIELVEERIQTKPRWQNFQDLVFAYDVLGESEKASEVYSSAEYRFPNRDFNRLESGTLRLLTYSDDSEKDQEDE